MALPLLHLEQELRPSHLLFLRRHLSQALGVRKRRPVGVEVWEHSLCGGLIFASVLDVASVVARAWCQRMVLGQDKVLSSFALEGDAM
jgi:hypothetical protein